MTRLGNARYLSWIVAAALGACSAPVSGPSGAAAADVAAGNVFDVAHPKPDTAQTDAAQATDAAADATATDASLPDILLQDAKDVAQVLDVVPDVPPDLPPDVPPLPELAVCPATLTITAPQAGAFLAKGTAVLLKAQVAGAAVPSDLQVEWSSDASGVLGTSAVDASGATQWSTGALPKGAQVLTAKIVTTLGICATGTDVKVSVCGAVIAETFDKAPAGSDWKFFKDASWDPGGWLELTGNEKSKQGAIYNTALYVQPGDVSMHFSIQTGGGINGGADGFAVTLIEAKNTTDVETFIAAGQPGGCLGYGVAPPCGTMKITAFHIEFDTFHNSGDPVTDPIMDDHIGILLNGDASDHKVVTAIPNLEDFQWHDVEIDVVGTTVHVLFDGVEKVTQQVAGLDFRGGYIVFTGSTGWATNFHRMGKLQILHQCQ